MEFTNPKDRIIVALDFSIFDAPDRINREATKKKLHATVEQLAPHVGLFKVGLELDSAIGAIEAIEIIVRYGGKVFLDKKFKDIPNTMAGAVRAAVQEGVVLIDIHASNTPVALETAAKNKGSAKLLGVTVMTNFTDDDARETYGDDCRSTVMKFARRVRNAGGDGLVCAVAEAQFLRKFPEFRDFILVTPAIRFLNESPGDQARVATPAHAMQAGATYIVMGRSISGATSPVEAAQRAAAEVTAGLSLAAQV